MCGSVATSRPRPYIAARLGLPERVRFADRVVPSLLASTALDVACWLALLALHVH